MEWQRQKEQEEKKWDKEEARRKQEKKNQKKKKVIDINQVAEEWEIWDKEEEAARLEEEAKKLVLEKLHKWIKMFGKNASERMLTRKVWDHAIDVKEEFVPRKGKIYSLSREKREEVREFIKKQLRKGYIRPSKSPQMAPVFFIRKKDGKKQMVQDYRYLSEWIIKNNYPNLRHSRKYWYKKSIYKDGLEVGV